jgi:hemin uptake protein HemP
MKGQHGVERSASTASSSQTKPPRRVDSRELLGASKEIEIVHSGQCYRLRITSLGKLILTK